MSSKNLTLLHYEGVLITELPHEKLILALERTTEELQKFYTKEAIRVRVLGKIEMIKRGESPC